MKILLAVDGSKSSLKAVDHLVEHASWFREAPAIELLTVHLPVPKLPNITRPFRCCS
jgi:nucleotide-binding universal stress UspA family protein